MASELKKKILFLKSIVNDLDHTTLEAHTDKLEGVLGKNYFNPLPRYMYLFS